ncbi:MAG: hypothetical protein ACQEXJ_22310 [Myxococcota bacterium]
MSESRRASVRVRPGSFEPERHYYPRVLNAHIHPVVRYLLKLGNRRIAERYCHLHPEADPDAVHDALAHRTRWFRWGGADLFHVTNEEGIRKMVVIETNSSASGQKSMPLLDEHQEQGGYRVLMERAFLPMLKGRKLPKGDLAVLTDKNAMECSGYAAALADLTGEDVHLVPCFEGVEDPHIRFEDRVLHVRTEEGDWRPVRAAVRYVTQRPWNRIPPVTRTAFLNPVLVCLAGGRNKMLASKAYEFYNAELQPRGMHIHAPETIWDVAHSQVPLWVARMGGVAVVKNPYSNAGQGVYTITTDRELEDFMSLDARYDRFIVQALIGNIGWSSRSSHGQLYHTGTVPNRRSQIYVADLRFMVGAGPEGFFPTAIYARRARRPLLRELDGTSSSWEMLGTNLSVRREDGGWDTESERLLLMDARDFNRLGVALDDLIEAYIQTVLSVTAIDQMARSLVNTKGRFRRRFFLSINPDRALGEEIVR